MVKCAVRGDLGPACNSAGMIDRYILGVGHLYKKPVYKNLKECNGQVLEDLPSWCLAHVDPKGILSSLTIAITSIIGLQYGHVLVQLESHKDRVFHWLLFSLPVFGLELILNYLGIPMNKSLYTISYMLLTSASAGITFCILFTMVDICGYRRLTHVFEWMGMHSLGIFILVSSNLAVIVIQGFYWISPENNFGMGSLRIDEVCISEFSILKLPNKINPWIFRVLGIVKVGVSDPLNLPSIGEKALSSLEIEN